MSQGGWDKARWVERGRVEGWRGMGQDWWGLGEGEETRERWRRIREGEEIRGGRGQVS